MTDFLKSLPPDERERVVKLGDEMTKLPMAYASPVYFGRFDRDAPDAEINNGTGTLVSIRGKQMCVTNHHVIARYRERKAEDQEIRFQVGHAQIDPDALVISESEYYDLVVLDMSRFKATDIATDGPVPTRYFETDSWPPPLPRAGGFIMFGGYPGYWREPVGPRTMRFDTISSGATEVHDAREDNIVCTLQLEKSITHSYVEGRNHPGELTGLSGGPVLMERKTGGGLSFFDLVGIIYEYSSTVDALYARPLSMMSEVGVVKAATW